MKHKNTKKYLLSLFCIVTHFSLHAADDAKPSLTDPTSLVTPEEDSRFEHQTSFLELKPKKSFQCPHCLDIFFQYRALVNHDQRKHQSNVAPSTCVQQQVETINFKTVLPCSICSKKYATVSARNAHERKAHSHFRNTFKIRYRK